MKRTVYMKVSSDKYELPMAVADSAEELSRILGVNKCTIFRAVYDYKHGTRKHSNYLKIVYDEEED